MSYADISFLLYRSLRLLLFCPAILPVQVGTTAYFININSLIITNTSQLLQVVFHFYRLLLHIRYGLFFALFPYYAKCKKQPLRCNENVLPFRQDKHQDIVQYRAVNSILSIFPGLTLVTLRSTLPFFCLRSSQQYNVLLEIPYALAA